MALFQPLLDVPLQDNLLQALETQPINPEELLDFVCPADNSNCVVPNCYAQDVTRSEQTDSMHDDWSAALNQFREHNNANAAQSPSYHSRASSAEQYRVGVPQSPFAYGSHPFVDTPMFTPRRLPPLYQSYSPECDARSTRYPGFVKEEASSCSAEFYPYSSSCGLGDFKAGQTDRFAPCYHSYTQHSHWDTMWNYENGSFSTRRQTLSGFSQPHLRAYRGVVNEDSNGNTAEVMKRSESTPAPQDSSSSSKRPRKRRSKRLDKREGEDRGDSPERRHPVKTIHSAWRSFRVVTGKGDFDFPRWRSSDKTVSPRRHAILIRTNELGKKIASNANVKEDSAGHCKY